MENLTAREIVTAVNALRLAAEQYRKDALDMRAAQLHRVSDQFTLQALEALSLAEKLEG